MKFAARVPMILALAALMFAASAAVADSRVRIVRLSYLQGDVSLDLGQGAGSQRAVTNMPVVEGARVWTGSDGQAEVEFEDGSTVRITPNTTLTFTALGLRESGVRVSTVAIAGGTAYVDVPRLSKEDEFTFVLTNRSLRLNHSVHFRIDMDAMEARIAVFKGQLDVTGTERDVDIRKGETLTLNFNDVNRYNLANSVASLAYDAWDKDRDDLIRDAAVNRNSQLGYGYGYADLMNYGTFMNVGGYGSCWRPYGIDYAWDPFSYGYWSFYPGWGYTWVSGYPWGWAPYRYGGWTWSNSFGWSWCPRVGNTYVNNWYNWNVVPVVVNAPPSYRRPHPPDPHVNLPPIIPVGRPPGERPWRGGLVSDKPSDGGKSANSGAPGNPANPDVEGRRGGRGIDSSHLNPDASGEPASRGRGPSVVVVTPPDSGGSGGEVRGRGPGNRGNIDLTPPGGSPSGRGPQTGGGPIQSPVPVMRSPRSAPDAGMSDRGRFEGPSPSSRGMNNDSPRMSSPGPSAPSAPMNSSHIPMGPSSDSGPRMSAPSAPSAPPPSSGGGERGGHSKPPVQ